MTTPDVGELGIPYTEIGSTVQSIGRVLVDRGWPKDQVVHQLIDGTRHNWFDEAGFWEDVLGPAVDRLAEALDLTGDPEERPLSETHPCNVEGCDTGDTVTHQEHPNNAG